MRHTKLGVHQQNRSGGRGLQEFITIPPAPASQRRLRISTIQKKSKSIDFYGVTYIYIHLIILQCGPWHMCDHTTATTATTAAHDDFTLTPPGLGRVISPQVLETLETADGSHREAR